MNNTQKTLLISFSLLLLQSTTACSTIGQMFSSKDNGSQTVSTGRRAPLLNPTDDPQYATRRVPVENIPLMDGNTTSPTAMSAPVTPVQINAAPIPSAASAPVVPLAAPVAQNAVTVSSASVPSIAKPTHVALPKPEPLPEHLASPAPIVLPTPVAAPTPVITSSEPSYTPSVAPVSKNIAPAIITKPSVTLPVSANEPATVLPAATVSKNIATATVTEPSVAPVTTAPISSPPLKATDDTPANLRGPKAFETTNKTISTGSLNTGGFSHWFHSAFSFNKKPAAPAVPATPSSDTAEAAPVTAVSTSDSPYPSLTSVPPAPEPLPKDNIKADFNSLKTQQKDSESDRNALMKDQNSTVMTSPKTGELVDNPTDAVPAPVLTSTTITVPAPTVAAQPAAPSNTAPTTTRFSNWVHGLFSSNKKPVTEGNTAPTATTQNLAPVSNAAPLTDSGTPKTATASSPAADADAIAKSNNASQGSAPVVFDITNHSAAPIADTTTTSVPAPADTVPAPVLKTETITAPETPAAPQSTTTADKPSAGTRFSNWAHGLFSSNKKTATDSNTVTNAAQNTTTTHITTPSTVTSSSSETSAQNLPPVEKLPPKKQVVTPAPTASLPSPAILTSSQPVAPSANAGSKLPDISQLSKQSDSAVDLVQPNDMTSSGEYIGDSRYSSHN